MRHVYEGWANGGSLWSVFTECDGKRRRKRPERRVDGTAMLLPFNGQRVRVTVESLECQKHGPELA